MAVGSLTWGLRPWPNLSASATMRCRWMKSKAVRSDLPRMVPFRAWRFLTARRKDAKGKESRACRGEKGQRDGKHGKTHTKE